jgi:segregation and condensation protein B
MKLFWKKFDMLKTKIESLLFISHKPLEIKQLVKLLNIAGENCSEAEVAGALDELMSKYGQTDGIKIILAGDGYQMVTNQQCAQVVKLFLKEESTGELTPASLETLTVIAYRGPISKLELEQIRGVNCSLILRNLLIRGLIVENFDKDKQQTYYEVTVELIKYLGINGVEELPDYEKLRTSENLQEFLQKQGERDIEKAQEVKIENLQEKFVEPQKENEKQVEPEVEANRERESEESEIY